jgi:hypothetical protein
MPLRDHFHHPARGRWRWKSIHSTWATCIIQSLNGGILPASYYAIPTVHLSSEAQVDITAGQDEEEAEELRAGNGAVATAVWAPPKPALVVPADLADLDVIEIEVRHEEEGYRLVATIELVSPANKDRPAHRRAFVARCAAYLQQEVSVVVVDVVTERCDSCHVIHCTRVDLPPPGSPSSTSRRLAQRTSTAAGSFASGVVLSPRGCGETACSTYNCSSRGGAKSSPTGAPTMSTSAKVSSRLRQ